MASIRDPLSSDKEAGNVSLLTYNDELAEQFRAVIHEIASKGDGKTLDALTELHLCEMARAAMEGAGIFRYTEAMAGLFSSPNQLARRTFFWEDSTLHVAYDWSKVCVEQFVYSCQCEAITDRTIGFPSCSVEKADDSEDVHSSHVNDICKVSQQL